MEKKVSTTVTTTPNEESGISKTFENVKESISSGTAHALEAIGLKDKPEPESTIDAIKVKIGLKDPEPESTIEKMKSKISSGYESMKSGFQTGDRTE